MSDNPFDDEDGRFLALINREEQYSLWPVFAQIPSGWEIVFGAPEGVPRAEVVEWIDRTWSDMRPRSLRESMAAQ